MNFKFRLGDKVRVKDSITVFEIWGAGQRRDDREPSYYPGRDLLGYSESELETFYPEPKFKIFDDILFEGSGPYTISAVRYDGGDTFRYCFDGHYWEEEECLSKVDTGRHG